MTSTVAVQIEKEKKNHTKPPVSLKGQLLWREFFYTVGGATKNFNKMEGNPICRQIDWDENDEFYKAWEESRTGYPWIDAIMMQLKQEGWMHHLARHAVACFLTRGDLYIHWEKGRDTFDRLLIDGDWHVNNGNWMWLSASAFFHQFFRVYSPVSFGKKYDKNGDFIRHFLPVLKASCHHARSFHSHDLPHQHLSFSLALMYRLFSSFIDLQTSLKHYSSISPGAQQHFQ